MASCEANVGRCVMRGRRRMHDAGGSALLASLILVLCIGGGALSGVVAKAAVDTGGPFAN